MLERIEQEHKVKMESLSGEQQKTLTDAQASHEELLKTKDDKMKELEKELSSVTSDLSKQLEEAKSSY